MDARTRQAIRYYFAEREDQPFGDVEAVSGQTLQPFSWASHQGARNLLDKAGKALAADDHARARSLVDRAVGLPYDRHEDTAPAAWAAQMKLFSLVTDAMEASDPEDSRWLDAAIEVLTHTKDPARYALRDVLNDLSDDYSMSAAEHARIREAISNIPERAELRDLGLGPADLGIHVMSIVEACNTYQAAFSGAFDA